MTVFQTAFGLQPPLVIMVVDHNYILVEILNVMTEKLYLLNIYGPPQKTLTSAFVDTLPIIRQITNLIVMGDFNCTKCHNPWLDNMVDVFEICGQQNSKFTYINASRENSRSRIDKIFIRNNP
ncbi:hypothetical protein O9G_005923 [Rozella allomycis CSF55]|uniref:Endonuclease/exonuclease/phosphatase domain-containing protein n=1 Tax=Rozella allomycis (strain CSF55) TaxID=988480 RepID=A0A075B4P9_ROZAC|nr:hypothetical protein O9G_005923 [Rozella allomycis CSF55]|eukprot:EPZ36369.1 hypothetical protein O9G_005923 [Rozella allomycis CSF55]